MKKSFLIVGVLCLSLGAFADPGDRKDLPESPEGAPSPTPAGAARFPDQQTENPEERLHEFAEFLLNTLPVDARLREIINRLEAAGQLHVIGLERVSGGGPLRPTAQAEGASSMHERLLAILSPPPSKIGRLLKVENNTSYGNRARATSLLPVLIGEPDEESVRHRRIFAGPNNSEAWAPLSVNAAGRYEFWVINKDELPRGPAHIFLKASTTPGANVGGLGLQFNTNFSGEDSYGVVPGFTVMGFRLKRHLSEEEQHQYAREALQNLIGTIKSKTNPDAEWGHIELTTPSEDTPLAKAAAALKFTATNLPGRLAVHWVKTKAEIMSPAQATPPAANA